MPSIDTKVLKEWIEENDTNGYGWIEIERELFYKFIDANSCEDKQDNCKGCKYFFKGCEKLIIIPESNCPEFIAEKHFPQVEKMKPSKEDTPITYSLEKRHTFDCQCSFCREMRGEGSGGTR